MTKLSATLPKDEANGMGAIARRLIDNPTQVHMVIALVDCASVRTDCDTGEAEPTARIRRIEPIVDDDDAFVAAARLYRNALLERTGRDRLPDWLAEELAALLGDDVDVDTGEVRRVRPDGGDDGG